MSAPRRTNAADRPPMDAPPWRHRTKPAAPRDVAAPRFVGDRAAIELRRRLALDGEAVPQPPLDLDAGRPVDRLALRVCAVIAVAALVGWGVASFSHARLPPNEARQARAAPAMAVTRVKPVPVQTAAIAAHSALAPIEMPAASHVTFPAEEKAPAPANAVPLPLNCPPGCLESRSRSKRPS